MLLKSDSKEGCEKMILLLDPRKLFTDEFMI